MRALRTGGHIEISEDIMNRIRKDCQGCGFDSYKEGLRGNEFLKLGAITLLRVKEGIYTLISSEAIKNEWIADTLVGLGKSVYLRYNNNGKESYVVSVKKKIVTEDNWAIAYRPISIVLLMHDLKSGVINAEDIKNVDGISTLNKEVHHNGYCYNNILGYAVVLSHEQHREYHEKHTQSSHQLTLKIESVGELKSTMEYYRKIVE